jgi:hypothetical protein
MTARALCLLLALAVPAAAQEATAPATPETAPQAAPETVEDAVPEDVRALFEALRLPEILDVMSAEGVADGDELARTIFEAGPVPSTWEEMLGSIYDPAHMRSEMLEAMAEQLEGEDTAAMLAFFSSEPGLTITARELETREALADEDAEQEAREAAAVAMAEESPRVELLRRYVESLDIVEYNVVGSLNSNFAYVSGLLDGGALGQEMTEGDILADIASQEGQIRADTTEWVLAFLLRAYEPLSDADIEALIAFSETDAGQTLNAAIFEAFDQRFNDISRALGLAAARFMTTEEL